MSRPLGLAGPLVGAGVVALVAALLHRTTRPVLEIGRYADAVLPAVEGVERHLAALEELSRTRQLADAVAYALRSPP